jgi:hypothetical protein
MFASRVPAEDLTATLSLLQARRSAHSISIFFQHYPFKFNGQA